jgi:perosamine synthetase
MNIRDIFWYPPAETRLSKKALLQALIGKAPEFSKELSSYLGVRECILADSGRGLLAELLKKLKKNSPAKTEVLIPGYTCYSVAASVVNAGLKIRLYDINPATFAPEIKSLEENLEKNTLAVLVQHLFGIPVKLEDINAAASKSGAWLIEDAAQGLGGSIAGRLLGTIGDFGLFSFGRGKPLPIGCGGALTGKHPEVLKRIAHVASGNGAVKVIKAAMVKILTYPLLYGILEHLPLGLGKTEFEPAFTCKEMPQRVNSLGSLSLNSFSDINSHRRLIASIYEEKLSRFSIPVPETGIAVFTRYPVMAGGRNIPLDLRRLGVRRMYPKAIADVPEIKPYLKGQGIYLPGARLIADKMITLPTHLGISTGLAQKIVLKVKGSNQCR